MQSKELRFCFLTDLQQSIFSPEIRKTGSQEVIKRGTRRRSGMSLEINHFKINAAQLSKEKNLNKYEHVSKEDARNRLSMGSSESKLADKAAKANGIHIPI